MLSPGQAAVPLQRGCLPGAGRSTEEVRFQPAPNPVWFLIAAGNLTSPGLVGEVYNQPRGKAMTLYDQGEETAVH